MARWQRKTPAEKVFTDLVRMSSTIPWWASVGFALLLFGFVPFNFPEPTGSINPNQVTGMFVGLIFGVIFKYFVPLALVIGGLRNLFQRGKSAWMFKSVSLWGAEDTLRQLGWKDFEFLISEYFKKQGFQVDLIDAQGADGGVDIRLHKGSELYLVQCKHYRAWKVSVKIVRELYGVMAAEGATGGFVVTTGKFTEDAISFAKDKQIELIDGIKLECVLDGNSSRLLVKESEATRGDVCPRCGNALLVRSGPRGKFWGCSSYPRCRYTKNF